MNQQSLSRKPRKTKAQWQQLINEFAGTSQSLEAFCLEKSIRSSRFAYWQRKLKRKPHTQTSLFVELPKIEPKPVASWDAELDFGDGVVLRLRKN